MDFSKLSYAQITSIADQLHTKSTTMDTLLTEIKSLLEKVGNDDVWSGTAAAETRSEFDKLSAKFPEFIQSIEDCNKYLLQVVENYKAVDNIIKGE